MDFTRGEEKQLEGVSLPAMIKEEYC
jgi:hypothetical protein